MVVLNITLALLFVQVKLYKESSGFFSLNLVGGCTEFDLSFTICSGEAVHGVPWPPQFRRQGAGQGGYQSDTPLFKGKYKQKYQIVLYN